MSPTKKAPSDFPDPASVVASGAHDIAYSMLAAGWRPDRDGSLHLMAETCKWGGWLASKKTASMFKKLGLDPDAKKSPDWGLSPLTISVSLGDLESAEALFRLGADPDGAPSQYPQGGPAHRCPDRAAILEFVAESGCDLSRPTKFGLVPPVVWANKKHSVFFMQTAFRLGAEPSARSADGSTALSEAFRLGHDGVARATIEAGGCFDDLVGSSDWPDNPRDMMAAIIHDEGDHPVRLRRLCSVIADAGRISEAMSYPDKNGLTPLQSAIYEKKWGSAEALIPYSQSFLGTFAHGGRTYDTLEWAILQSSRSLQGESRVPESFLYRLFSKAIKLHGPGIVDDAVGKMSEVEFHPEFMSWVALVRDRAGLVLSQRASRPTMKTPSI